MTNLLWKINTDEDTTTRMTIAGELIDVGSLNFPITIIAES